MHFSFACLRQKVKKERVELVLADQLKVCFRYWLWWWWWIPSSSKSLLKAPKVGDQQWRFYLSIWQPTYACDTLLIMWHPTCGFPTDDDSLHMDSRLIKIPYFLDVDSRLMMSLYWWWFSTSFGLSSYLLKVSRSTVIPYKMAALPLFSITRRFCL